MAEQYLLAHDVGTSATKTSIVRPDGRIEDSEATPHPTRYPQPGWAEQDAEDWWRGVCRNTRALAERQPHLGRRVAAVGVSGHMLGCLALGEDGRPLRPAMMHSDIRAGEQCARVERAVGAEKLYQTTGNILDARSPLCKILWLKDNEPSVYANAARFLQSKDYVVGCMVGSFDSTDYSDAAHAQWMDIRRQVYAEEVLRSLGLDTGKLPALHAATDVVGRLTDSAAEELGLRAGVPVVAGGGDGSCATVGAGAVHAGDTYCCIGTTAWIASTVAEPFIDPERRIFNLTSLDGKSCGVFGTVQAAGRSVDWAMELLGEEDFGRFEELLSGVGPGSDGLVFLPYLEGERSPVYDADARGVFFGITPNHGRRHFLRATVEGVCFALRSVLEVIQESVEVPAMRLIGGGGQSATWQQILADACGVSVQTLSTRAADATSLGAAVAAGVGVGIFADLAEGTDSVRVEQERTPEPTAAQAYGRLFAVYSALYPRLAPVYQELRRALTPDSEH